MLSVERRAAVFAELREETAAEIVRRLAPEEVAVLLDDLEADDVADILGRVEEGLLRQILTRLDPEDADAWMLAGIMRSGQGAEDAFRSALGAQTVDLLAADGVEKILDRFTDLPGTALPLALYRRLHEQRATTMPAPDP